jgi:hypothetical protein
MRIERLEMNDKLMASSAWRRLGWVLCAAFFAAGYPACAADNNAACRVGSETCECGDDDACEPGLSCASGLCVQADSGGAGKSSSGAGGAGSNASGSSNALGGTAPASAGKAGVGGSGASTGCTGNLNKCVDDQTVEGCDPTTGMPFTLACDEDIPAGLINQGCGVGADGGEACLIDFEHQECLQGATVLAVCLMGGEDGLINAYLNCYSDHMDGRALVTCLAPYLDAATETVDCDGIAECEEGGPGPGFGGAGPGGPAECTPTGASDDFVEASVDGEATLVEGEGEAYVEMFAEESQLYVSACDGFTCFQLITPPAVGTYPCGDDTMLAYSDADENDYAAGGEDGGDCMITITSFGCYGQRITGTFSGTLVDGGTGSVEITGGSFDVPRDEDL